MDFWGFLAAWGLAYLIASGLLALIPAYVAQQRGRSYGAFWLLSFAFSIFVGLLVVLALPEVKEEVAVARTDEDGNLVSSHTSLPENITCPQCAETVKSRAKVCRFCGFDLVEHISNLEAQVSANAAAHEEVLARQNAEEQRAELEKQEKAALAKQWIRIHWYLPLGAVVLLAAGSGFIVSGSISAEQDALRSVEQKQLQRQELVTLSEAWEVKREQCEAWGSVVELESTQLQLHISTGGDPGTTECLLASVGFSNNSINGLLASDSTGEEFQAGNLTAFNDHGTIRIKLEG